MISEVKGSYIDCTGGCGKKLRLSSTYAEIQAKIVEMWNVFGPNKEDGPMCDACYERIEASHNPNLTKEFFAEFHAVLDKGDALLKQWRDNLDAMQEEKTALGNALAEQL